MLNNLKTFLPNVQNFYDSLHPAVVHVIHDIVNKGAGKK